MITVKEVKSDGELQEAFNIREKVYIEEQQIDRADEFDEFDDTSVHFIAHDKGEAAGTARYRKTSEGYKLERFAVLPEFRKRGVAGLLMHTMLDHIGPSENQSKKLYLNAQESAIGLYVKYGFEEEGDRFMECDIPHQKMFRYI